MGFFKEFKKNFIEGYCGNMGTLVKYIKYNNKSIPVLHSKNKIVAQAYRNARGFHFIVVGDLYMDAPESIQSFIDYHELGHIYALEHGRPNQFILEDELIADKYGVDHTSVETAVMALVYLQSISDDPQLPDRLKAIM